MRVIGPIVPTPGQSVGSAGSVCVCVHPQTGSIRIIERGPRAGTESSKALSVCVCACV